MVGLPPSIKPLTVAVSPACGLLSLGSALRSFSGQKGLLHHRQPLMEQFIETPWRECKTEDNLTVPNEKIDFKLNSLFK